MGKCYFTEIKMQHPIWEVPTRSAYSRWKGHGRHPTRLRLRNLAKRPTQVKPIGSRHPEAGWTRAIIKEGSEGPIVCNFAFLRLTESRRKLAGARSLADHPPAFCWILRSSSTTSVNAPATTPLIEFVRISGMRWPIETTFKESKGEVGFDHYKMRSWLVASSYAVSLYGALLPGPF